VERSVSFVAAADDALSPAFAFAWRLDGGEWSPYGAATITVSDLTAGPHRVEVKARDEAGNEDSTPAVQDFTVIALTIHIIDPAPGAILGDMPVWVRGTVQGGGRDVGVTVSTPPELRSEVMAVTGGLDVFPAISEAGTFAVKAWVTPTTRTLTVAADDGRGGKASDTVAVSVNASAAQVDALRPFRDAGLAPLTLRFGASAPGAVRYEIDLESDGVIDFEGPTLLERDFTYSRPGVYVPTVRALADDGAARVFRAAVYVYDAPLLLGRLQATWRGFKDGLRAGDITAATAFIHSGRRVAWSQFFQQFTADMFARVDEVFTDITIADVPAPGTIECEVTVEENGITLSYPVSFALDGDGRWRLWQF
jgi:hypothetical protein